MKLITDVTDPTAANENVSELPLEVAARRRRTWIHCLLLAIASAAVWATGAAGEFVWIDHVEIEEAGYRVTDWDDFKLVWSTSLDGYLERGDGKFAASGGYYRPVYALLISLDWLMWGVGAGLLALGARAVLAVTLP